MGSRNMRSRWMWTTSTLGLGAIAAALAGVQPALTADLAGNLGGACCTDLEQRIAELKATAARKGNRKLSLQIYGQVSEVIMWWNDGAEKNAYVQNNYATRNTVGFQGAVPIDNDWSAGFRLDLQVRAFRSSFANQYALGENNGLTTQTYDTQSVTLRYANWYLDSKTYGRISLGRDNDPALGIIGINLASPDGFAANGTNAGYANGGFFLRRKGTTGNGGLSGLNWQNFAWIRNGDGPASLDYAQTANAAKYSSPFFLGRSAQSGFNVQAFWGQDDVWSTALRYAEDFGVVRVAAGVGYSNWTGLDRGSCSNTSPTGSTGTGPGATATTSSTRCDAWQLGASIMHAATGLYLSGGGGWLTDYNRQLNYDAASSFPAGARNVFARPGVDASDSVWWAQAGWEAKLNGLGATTFWGQYSYYNTGTGTLNSAIQTVAATDVINSLGRTAFIAGTQTRTWGLGVTQAIDAAAMNVHVGYLNFATEGHLVDQNPANNARVQTRPIDPMSVVYTGATIRF